MRTSSIRTHILLLVLAVFIPFVAAVGLSIYSDMQQSMDRTKISLRILANTMATSTGKRIASSREMLELLASLPLIMKTDPDHCDEVLKDVLVLHPGFANIGYTDMKGHVICSALPQQGGMHAYVGNALWYQQLTKEKRFVAGRPFRGDHRQVGFCAECADLE